MDFREREIDFQEADRRYAELKRQLDAKSISDEEFDAQRQQLMVQDEESRWWAKFGKSGEWHYRDGDTWLRGTPPDYQEAISESNRSLVRTSSPPPGDAENGENRPQIPPWVLAAIRLVGVALVSIVLIVWVLVPYLRGEPASSKQGESMMSEQGEPVQSRQDDSAVDGDVFNAAFIHRAAPENISGNSTYIDNPQINDDPSAILYVTQNWNPGAGAGIYNDHPIGVWYDSSRQRWAIFNQDRETMPDGAAFNVAVLQE